MNILSRYRRVAGKLSRSGAQKATKDGLKNVRFQTRLSAALPLDAIVEQSKVFDYGTDSLNALAGVLAGLLGAFLLTRFMSSVLYGVGPMDPETYVSLAVGLGCVALFACYLPARRATRTDPIVALRNE